MSEFVISCIIFFEDTMNLDKDYFKNDNNKNATVESFLNEGEIILWRGKAKKSAYVAGKSLAMAPVAILWGCIDFTILISIFNSGAPSGMLLFLIPFFALHLTPVWIWLKMIFSASKEQKTIEYVITNCRVIEFRDNPKYIYKSIYLDKMVDVSLRIGFIDKILGVGDITIYSENSLLSPDAVDTFKYFGKKNSKVNIDEFNKCLVLSDITDSVNIHRKLLNICHGNLSQDAAFAEPQKYECPNCGTLYSEADRCPSCGAPKTKQ